MSRRKDRKWEEVHPADVQEEEAEPEGDDEDAGFELVEERDEPEGAGGDHYAYEYEDDPIDIGESAVRRRRRWPWVLLAMVVVVLVVGVYGIFWVNKQISPGGERGDVATVVIKSGAGRKSVAKALADAKVIHNATVFEQWLRFNGEGKFTAGTYELPQNMSYNDALQLLNKGPAAAPVSSEKLVIPEGFTLAQIAGKVGNIKPHNVFVFGQTADEGLVRSRYQPDGVNSLEGLVFPATYQISSGEDEEAILRKMVNAFDAKADAIGLTEGAQALGHTPYEAIIIASLIEKEAKFDEDRPKISCVIENRLKKKMPLGIDATSLYGPPANGDLDLLPEALAADSPYNTRKNVGLPPTPIASAGEASLEAAIHPTENCSFLYYVLADAEGHHAFASTDAEFQRLKADAKRKGLIP